MQREYVPRMINLERSDYQIVKRMAEERGLGDKGFSAALRTIIRKCMDNSLYTTQVYLHRLEGQTDTSWSRVAALLGLDSSPESGRHPERSVATLHPERFLGAKDAAH